MKLKILHAPLYNANLASIPYWEYTKNLYKTFIFTEESKYETKNPKDQADWNKLTGLASHLFNSQKSSHMWAWRYYKGNFEVAPYSHDANGNKILPKENEILIIPQDITIKVFIDVEHQQTVSFQASFVGCDYYLAVKSQLPTSKDIYKHDKYRVIQAWFGGTSLPKKTVKVYGQ